MERNIKSVFAKLLAIVMVFSVVDVTPSIVGATSKKSTSITVSVGKTKKVRIKGVKVKKIKKTIWSIKNRKIATLLKKKKNSVTVKGKKAGTTKLTAKIKIGKKSYKRSCKLKVRSAKNNDKKNNNKKNNNISPIVTVIPMPNINTIITPAPNMNTTVTPTPNINVIPTPNYEPVDDRPRTVVENFEDYPVGYNWESDDMEGTSGKATRGKEYVGKNVGQMTVVQDPENPNNKCLKIEYNGDTQAYDYAPIFNLTLKKSLEEYSGVMIQSRVVSHNTGDSQHKTVAAYFSKHKSITPEHYFATSLTKGDAKAKGISEDLVKFSADASHANGKDETYNVKGGEFDYMTYNNHSFPMFYNDWSKDGGKKPENRTVGFKESESDNYKAGWHQNKLTFNKDNITEEDVVINRRISMVIGSNYAGNYTHGASLTLYLDNLTFLETIEPCTAIKLNNAPTKIAKGMKMSIAKEDIVYTPENTTQTQLTWTSSDESIITVDVSKSSPVLQAISAGKATIKAAVTKNPSITMSFDIEVFEPKLAASDFVIDLAKVRILPKTEEGDEETKVFSSFTDYKQSATGLTINFTEANIDYIVLDLGQSYDMTQYKGFCVVGEATDQMAVEWYSDNVDFREDDWFIKQIEYAGYPFFGGSHPHRSFEGTSYGEVGAEETLWCNWVATPKAPSSAVPKGDMTNIRYLVLKANKYDTALHKHKWILKKLIFKIDEYVNTNPTDAEIEANGGKWFDKNAK